MLSLNRRAASLVIAVGLVSLAIACGSKNTDADATSVPTVDRSATTQPNIEPTLPPLQSGASVIFVIDQSASMSDDLGSVTRWEAVSQAFADNGPGTALGALSERALIGASIFSGTSGDGGCPLKAGISPGTGNLTRISGLIGEAEPLSGAPVGDAIDDATSTLRVFPGTRVIVLITDGAPDSCDSEADAVQAEQQAVARILAGFVRRIETRVIALGNDAPDRYLRQLANAGVGITPDEQPASSDEPEYWRVNSASELKDAIDAIVNDIQPIS